MMGPILGGSPRIKFASGNTYVDCEGDSLTSGDGSLGQTWPLQLSSLAPLSGLATVNNYGGSGQTIAGAIGYGGLSTDKRLQQLPVAYKNKILVVWLGTNSIAQTNSKLTSAQALADMETYTRARIAANPTAKIILLTTLPRMGGAWGDALTNQYLAEFNEGVMANAKSWGATAVVDVRQPGSPFRFTGYTSADFNASSVAPYWKAGETTHIHLCPAGYALIAQMVADAIKRLPAR